MRVPNRTLNLLVKVLTESLSPDLMRRVMQRIVPDYDLYERTGIPRNIPIQTGDIARQISADVGDGNRFRRMLEALIDVNDNGHMGRRYTIRHLRQLIREVEDAGYYYDEETGLFMEGDEIPKTPGWGYLEEGTVHEFAFLRLDIVKNSQLVRTYPEKVILRTYRDVRELATHIIEQRNGRIWKWEGDGGLAAFYFADKNVQAALTGMELLLELFLYNLRESPLKEQLRVRIAAHAGSCPFSNQLGEVRSDALNEVEVLEAKHTRPNTFTLSPGAYTDLGTKLTTFFKPFTAAGKNLYRYTLVWER